MKIQRIMETFFGGTSRLKNHHIAVHHWMQTGRIIIHIGRQ
ncbi:hypothetical protein NSS94_13515 [Paenibacillus sp. FSL L8-0644]|nr:hypothetical protein [Paenibacillus polymyxa]